MTALGPLENCDWAYIKAHLHIRAISFRPAITATAIAKENPSSWRHPWAKEKPRQVPVAGSFERPRLGFWAAE
jgi:hypothetical protein